MFATAARCALLMFTFCEVRTMMTLTPRASSCFWIFFDTSRLTSDSGRLVTDPLAPLVTAGLVVVEPGPMGSGMLLPLA